MSNLSVQDVFADPNAKARLFALTRAWGAQRTSAMEHRRRLQEAAGLVPGFERFRQWCLEDIKAAFFEDRQSGTRLAKNRRLAWLHLFKYFARLRKLDRALEIRALDRQGNYTCELVERTQADRWGRLVRLAAEFGIGERDLLALCERPGGATEKAQRQQEAAQA